MRRIRVLVGVVLLGAASLVAPVAARAAPANDDFAGALEITSVPYASPTVSVPDAGIEPGEPWPSCFGAGSLEPQRTLWFRYTPQQDVQLVADTYRSYPWTAVAVWTGSSLATLQNVGCGFYSQGRYNGQVRFDAEAGTTYHFQVGAHYDLFAFDLSPPPGNDDRADAEPVADVPFEDEADLTFATLEDEELRCSNLQFRTVWWRYTAVRSEPLVAYSPELTTTGVYRQGSDGSLVKLGCTPAFDTREIDDPAVRFDAEAGRTYLIQVGTDAVEGCCEYRGKVRMRIGPPPANDDRAQALHVGSLPFEHAVDSRAATVEPGEGRPCGDLGRTMWYRWTPGSVALGRAEVVDAEPWVSEAIAVYARIGGEDVLIRCASGLGGASVIWPTLPDTEYWVQAGSSSNSGGRMTVRLASL